MFRNPSATLNWVGVGAAVGLVVGMLISVTWTMSLPSEEDPELQEARQLIELAKTRIADNRDYGGIPDTLKWLRRALELDPGNVEANVILANASQNALAIVREELLGGRPAIARGLLDIFDDEWPGDTELLDLRTETSEMFDELSRATELAILLDRAQADIAEKRLREPKDDNAWERLNKAETLIAEDDSGRRNWVEANRQRIADEYAKLIEQAIAQGSLVKAQRYLASLGASAPGHSEQSRLRQELAAARDVRATAERELIEAALVSSDKQAAVARPTVAAMSSPRPESPPTVFASASAMLDEEDEFWAKVKNQFTANSDCSVLQRYNEQYPGGRFENEYFALKAECSRQLNY